MWRDPEAAHMHRGRAWPVKSDGDGDDESFRQVPPGPNAWYEGWLKLQCRVVEVMVWYVVDCRWTSWFRLANGSLRLTTAMTCCAAWPGPVNREPC